MKKTFRTIVGTGVLAAALSSGAAYALPFINGSIGFSDGGITLSLLPNSIVNQLTTITLGSAATTGCNGGPGNNFSSAPGVCISASNVIPTSNFILPAGTGTFTYAVGADTYTFSFSIISGAISRVANHDVGGGLINDSLGFLALGTVTDSLGLFAATAASFNFGATGTCTNASGGVTCDTNTASSSWSGTLNALGRNTTTPEPATLGLLGIALVGLGFSRRRKQA